MSECKNCGRGDGAHYAWCTNPAFVRAATFDHNAPLPPAPNYRPREWETEPKDKP